MPEEVNGWIDDIAALPTALRRIVSGLSESQLDTPYPGWLDGPAGGASLARQPYEQLYSAQAGIDRKTTAD
jgi:hypothetical protein